MRVCARACVRVFVLDWDFLYVWFNECRNTNLLCCYSALFVVFVNKHVCIYEKHDILAVI